MPTCERGTFLSYATVATILKGLKYIFIGMESFQFPLEPNALHITLSSVTEIQPSYQSAEQFSKYLHSKLGSTFNRSGM